MSEDTAMPAPRLSAALNSIHRGWPVVPLHDVTMGFCSCNEGSEKHASTSAGKHPLAKAWQHSAVTDEAIIRGLFNGRPGMNFGIKTGLTAGIWVLDVDPKHEGDKRLAELTSQHGNLPDTYTQSTGSGGLHYFWSLPPDFTPTNSKGSLPAGLDVRGEGGFVVAAPCVSGIGPYETLLDLPVAAAPGWLLDMIRPRVPADVEHQAAMAHIDHPAFTAITDRGARYAHAAVYAELAKLANAVPGERGFTAFRVACSLHELLNSPWAQLGEEMVKQGFASAAARAMDHGGAFDQQEAWAAWASAARRIGAKGRAAPGSGVGGVLVGWSAQGGVPPFGGSPQSDSHGDSHSDPREFSLFSPHQDAEGGPGQTPVDLFSSGFSPILTDQIAADPVDLLISKFISVRALSELPPPAWLVDNWIVRNSACWIVGKSNDGKSFVALDMAMCVASGISWHGQKVHKGRVGYVVAEGASGMGQRAVAWQKTFNGGEDVENIVFLPMPVQAADHTAWDTLIMAVARMRLDLVILDTQARVTVGLEENSAKEMGLFVDQVERLRMASGAAVVLVHHLRKAGGEARGSGAMYGAAQTEIMVARAQDIVTVSITKQKDGPYAEPVRLQLSSVEVRRTVVVTQGWIGVPDEVVTAGVLLDVDASQAAEWEGLSSKARLVMVLNDVFPGRGALKGEAKSICLNRGMPSASFYRAWDNCLKGGVIVQVMIDDKLTSRYIVSQVDDRDKPDILTLD